MNLDSIRELLQSDELEQAAERLRDAAAAVGNETRREAGVWSASVHHLRKKERQGVVTAESLAVERAKLVQRGLLVLEEIERRMVKPRPSYRGRVDLAAPVLEKAIGVTPMRHLAWVRRGLDLSRAVCRLAAPSWYGTGFVISGGWVVTNHHVIQGPSDAAEMVAEFNYEEDLNGRPLPTTRYRLDPSSWVGDRAMDCARVRLVPNDGAPPIEEWGTLSFETAQDPAVGDHIAIIQHPDGGPKKIAMAANQVVNIYDHCVQYVTDTLPGSSGAPVFNDRWRVVAVHHAGGNLARNGRGDPIYANQGIIARHVARALRLGD